MAFEVGSTVYSVLFGASEVIVFEAVLLKVLPKGNFRVKMVGGIYSDQVWIWNPDCGVFSTKQEAARFGRLSQEEGGEHSPKEVKDLIARAEEKARKAPPSAKRRARPKAA